MGKKSLRILGIPIYQAETEEKRSIGAIDSIENPNAWFWQLLGMQNSTGINVNADSALTLPVYYGALKVISEDIAKLPGGVFRINGSNRERINHPVDNLYFLQPNNIMNSFHWRQCPNRNSRNSSN